MVWWLTVVRNWLVLFSKVVRLFQTGFIYHYAFIDDSGVLGFLLYFMLYHSPNKRRQPEYLELPPVTK